MPNSTATPHQVGPVDPQIVDLQAQVARLQQQVATLRAERARLCWAVGHDELTGLPNRRLFHALAPRILDAGAGRPAAVVVLDLDGFKPVNDRWGHHVGDHVLRTAARRLADVAAGHLVARLGGDEFAAVVTYPFPTGRPTWWRPIVDALSTALAEPMTVGGRDLTVRASIGVATAEPSAPVGDLLHRADQAMYLAKRRRTNPAIWAWQHPDDHTPWQERQSVLVGRPGVGANQRAGRELPPPTMHPSQRDPAQVAPASSYRPSDRVWVYRDGAWRTGIVDSASPLAITATYRRSSHHGTGVDTVTAQYVLPRGDTARDLDRRLAYTA